jgi:hypothetical protein
MRSFQPSNAKPTTRPVSAAAAEAQSEACMRAATADLSEPGPRVLISVFAAEIYLRARFLRSAQINGIPTQPETCIAARLDAASNPKHVVEPSDHLGVVLVSQIQQALPDEWIGLVSSARTRCACSS